jgi:sugar/nucleoside kinase (ribokinase family)
LYLGCQPVIGRSYVSEAPIDYLVIGHVCQDYTPFGIRWGGTALFGAITADRLGARVHVLTSTTVEGVREALPADALVHNIETSTPLIFRHDYVEGRRQLSVVSTAPTLHTADLPSGWRSLGVVHFGPLAHEVEHTLVSAFDGSLLGASVQGWMRHWGKDGLVAPLPAAHLLEWAPSVDCSFLSEEDIGDRREVIDFYRTRHRIVALTDGAHGATIYEGPLETRVPAVPVQEVDANGAGDVFAAAYLIRYKETGDAILSAQFAAAVASFHVEQIGTVGIPTRAQAERRWQEFYGR